MALTATDEIAVGEDVYIVGTHDMDEVGPGGLILIDNGESGSGKRFMAFRNPSEAERHAAITAAAWLAEALAGKRDIGGVFRAIGGVELQPATLFAAPNGELGACTEDASEFKPIQVMDTPRSRLKARA